MKAQGSRMFSMHEAATAYAEAAERLFGDNGGYLDTHSAVVPIFVSHLFQSLEISIKAAGIESGLFTMEEARRAGKGHGIEELAAIATDINQGTPYLFLEIITTLFLNQLCE